MPNFECLLFSVSTGLGNHSVLDLYGEIRELRTTPGFPVQEKFRTSQALIQMEFDKDAADFFVEIYILQSLSILYGLKIFLDSPVFESFSKSQCLNLNKYHGKGSKV